MVRHSLTFVNLTADTIVSGAEQSDDLSSIRSHAMRAVRKHRTWTTKNRKSHAKAPVKVADLSHGSIITENLTLNWYDMTFVTQRPLLPSKVPADAAVCLDYFLYGFTPLTFPTRQIQHGCGMLITLANTGDLALLHALCAISILHRNQVRQSPASSPPHKVNSREDDLFIGLLQHKLRAITLLRGRFSETMNVSQYSSSIAAVLLLLLIEVLSGEKFSALAHQKGMIELLRQPRREDDTLDLLKSDILMDDIKSATLNSSLPSAEPPQSWRHLFDQLKIHPTAPGRATNSRMGHGFFTSEMYRDLGVAFVRILSAMRQLIDTVEEHLDDGRKATAIDGRQFLVLEYELLTLTTGRIVGDTVDKHTHECCRLAALLYCNLCIWTWPKDAKLVESLLSQLRAAILDWKLDPLSHENTPFLLWLYFLGTSADSTSETGDFFRWGSRVVAESLQLRTEDALRTRLLHFFYVPRMLDKHLPTVLQGPNGR